MGARLNGPDEQLSALAMLLQYRMNAASKKINRSENIEEAMGCSRLSDAVDQLDSSFLVNARIDDTETIRRPGRGLVRAIENDISPFDRHSRDFRLWAKKLKNSRSFF